MRTHGCLWGAGCIVWSLFSGGCGNSEPKTPAPSPSASAVSSLFNPALMGTIEGQVTWTGPIPSVEPLEGWALPLVENGPRKRLLEPNPHAPRIDLESRGVGNAVIYLRDVDRRYAKPWSHGPVRVEQRDYQIHVWQGNEDGRYGFVRRGDALEMVSRDPFFHSLHIDGASFFTLTFPDPDRPLSRTLADTGLIEMTSACGYFWMRGYLWVDDNPYYARTDARGRFRLEEVPEGTYEVACWMPDWSEDHHERDPEGALITRMIFLPAVELHQETTVRRSAVRALEFRMRAEVFGKKARAGL